MNSPITRHMPASSSFTSLYHKSLIEASPNEMYGGDPDDESIEVRPVTDYTHTYRSLYICSTGVIDCFSYRYTQRYHYIKTLLHTLLRLFRWLHVKMCIIQDKICVKALKSIYYINKSKFRNFILICQINQFPI